MKSKNYYSALLFVCVVLLSLVAPSMLTASQSTAVVSGGATASVNGTYTYAGTSNSRPYFDLASSTMRLEYRNGGFGLEWEMWESTARGGSGTVRYFNADAGINPPSTGWLADVAGNPPPTVAVTYSVDFTDGSSYAPGTATPGTNNNPIGRFFLSNDASLAAFTALTIQTSGSPSGITAVKLWSSTDAAFNAGSDTQLKSASYGASVSFSSFSSGITSAGLYYFVTVDLSADASGSISASITSNADLTFSTGTLAGTISNAPLSGESTPLPVEVTFFTGSRVGNDVHLCWTTAVEVNNYGFNIERKQHSEWTMMGFIQGAGTSNAPKEYSFVDRNPAPGIYVYRIKQIDNDGSFRYYVGEEIELSAPSTFGLEQNYPNPFNPSTVIRYSLPFNCFVHLEVFNTLGQQIEILVGSNQSAGYHEVTWKPNAASGFYIYRIDAASADNPQNRFVELRKAVLMK